MQLFQSSREFRAINPIIICVVMGGRCTRELRAINPIIILVAIGEGALCC